MYRNTCCALISFAVEIDFTSVKDFDQISMKEIRNGSEDACNVCNTAFDGPCQENELHCPMV